MKAIAVILMVSALAIAVVPMFTDCESQGRGIELPNGMIIPMRCHWTGEAEIAVAVPLFLAGGLLFFSKRRESQRALSILGIALGAFAILLPTVLIGVCANDSMLCNSLMRPTLIFTGTIAIAASIIGLARVAKEQPTVITSSGKPV